MSRRVMGWIGGGLAVSMGVLAIGVYFGERLQPLLGWKRSAEVGAPGAPPRSAPDSNAGSPPPRQETAAAAPPETEAATGSVSPPPVARPYTWSAARQGDEVLLTGHVPSEAARAEMLAIARREIGDVPVADRTQVAAGLDPGVDFAAAASAALASLDHLQDGRVEMTDNRLAVRGEAKDKEALAEVTASLRDLPRGLELAAVAVTAPVVAPYAFSAERAPGVVTLSGYLPSAEARAEVARHIRSRFFHERIVDKTRLADGAPSSFMAVATFALDQLSQLAAGEASVTGDTVRVAGEALYAQAAAQMRDRLAKGAPGGWRGIADIKLRGASTAQAEAQP